jgi:polyphosphate kinase
MTQPSSTLTDEARLIAQARAALVEGTAVDNLRPALHTHTQNGSDNPELYYLAAQLLEDEPLPNRLAYLTRALELDDTYQPAQRLQTQLTQQTAQAIPEINPSLLLPLAVRPQPYTPPPPTTTDPIDLDHPALYFNIELAWLDFNWRVLFQALDERTPLLERIRFIAITASNLDEFTQKRIGGLKRQQAAHVRNLTADGRTPERQIDLIHQASHEMHRRMTQEWETTLRPALAQATHAQVCDYDDLSPSRQAQLHDYYTSQIYPILTPLADDPARPFPFISGLSLSLAVTLHAPDTPSSLYFARVKVPSNLPRWITLEPETAGAPYQFLPVEQLITAHIDALFPGMELLSVHPFRVTRNADVGRDEEEADDLLELISDELRERRFASVVRLEIDQNMPEHVSEWLRLRLGLDPEDIDAVDGLLDLTALFFIADLEYPDLKYSRWEPRTPARLRYPGSLKDAPSMFSLIRQGDILVHHPYESFDTSVLRFVQEAARDSRVLAIKQTLYRTSSNSAVVQALVQAAQAGKQVAVLVELRARFDEENNIGWARTLERAGVHVTYGLIGLKTHTKVTLVVRQERGVLRTYAHIGTGNYNSKTARLYTDLGIFTCRPELGNDVVRLFHYLTGYAAEQTYEKVLVAPRYMYKKFVELIRREVASHQQFGNGRIVAKMNGLDHVGIIKELYKASQAGVQIELLIRGHSRLRPGLPGVSENIRVYSLLGRFLEHDRIFYFHNNEEPEFYIGSADWRGRNLNARVELITPVEDAGLQKRLWRLLTLALQDNRLLWELQPDGRYVQRRPAPGEPVRNFHEQLMLLALE